MFYFFLDCVLFHHHFVYVVWDLFLAYYLVLLSLLSLLNQSVHQHVCIPSSWNVSSSLLKMSEYLRDLQHWYGSHASVVEVVPVWCFIIFNECGVVSTVSCTCVYHYRKYLIAEWRQFWISDLSRDIIFNVFDFLFPFLLCLLVVNDQFFFFLFSAFLPFWFLLLLRLFFLSEITLELVFYLLSAVSKCYILRPPLNLIHWQRTSIRKEVRIKICFELRPDTALGCCCFLAFLGDPISLSLAF